MKRGFYPFFSNIFNYFSNQTHTCASKNYVYIVVSCHEYDTLVRIKIASLYQSRMETQPISATMTHDFFFSGAILRHLFCMKLSFNQITQYLTVDTRSPKCCIKVDVTD
jgi:hypothetical protein